MVRPTGVVRGISAPVRRGVSISLVRCGAPLVGGGPGWW